MKQEENLPIWASKKRVPSRTPFWTPRVPSRTPSGDPFLSLLEAENVIITVVLRLGPFWGGALFEIVMLLFYDFLKCRFRETMRWKCYKKQRYFNYFKNYAFKKLGFECILTNEIIDRRLEVQRVNKICNERKNSFFSSHSSYI